MHRSPRNAATWLLRHDDFFIDRLARCDRIIAEAAMICSTCGKAIQAGGVFCSNCGSAIDGTRYALEQRRLTRPIGSRAIAGVCSGIAQYFGWDVSNVRLVTAVTAFFGAGAPVLLYFVAWFLMPNSPQVVRMQTTSETDVAAQ